MEAKVSFAKQSRVKEGKSIKNIIKLMAKANCEVLAMLYLKMQLCRSVKPANTANLHSPFCEIPTLDHQSLNFTQRRGCFRGIERSNNKFGELVDVSEKEGLAVSEAIISDLDRRQLWVVVHHKLLSTFQSEIAYLNAGELRKVR